MNRPRFLSLAPILPTSDMDRMADHYRQLGFTVRIHDPGYGTASRDGFNLHFHQAAGGGGAGGMAGAPGAVYFGVDDAEALHRQWVASGVGETGDLFDPGYGVWEAAHTDPDGNVIRFGSPIPEQPALDGAQE
jgi:predicted enzyme related to lactoylglutathione lyase